MGLNEIFLELWSIKALPSCHQSMGTSEPPFLCFSLSSCRAQSSAEPEPAHLITCSGCQSNTAWEHGLCIQQNQSSACPCSLPSGNGCGSIYVSYEVVRSLTQHMENPWPRFLKPDIKSRTPLLRKWVHQQAAQSDRSTAWLFWGRPFAESNLILIGPKWNWRGT